MANNFGAQIKWNEQGLVCAVVQDFVSGQILMQAWMNFESLQLTVQEGRAVYWSRSRQKIWRKGEESGHIQRIKDILLDCDGDCLLLKVEQIGEIACHTGRRSCFYRKLTDNDWQIIAEPIKNSEQIYK